MGIEIGIMIEGQEGLTWDRWFAIAERVEQLGFAHLFRSDHLTALGGQAARATLALWPSLTALALKTKRLRFGPMVASMTFRQPAMVAKMAASVSQLANGRLDLGIGAGWYAGEHAMFGIPYPGYGTRLRMLDEAATVIRALWSGKATDFAGEFYRLQAAENHPGPQPDTRLIFGGKGDKTLAVVAKHADEWNFSYAPVSVFREKWARLAEHAAALGRDPAREIVRSVMVPFVIGSTPETVQRRIDGHRATFANLPADVGGWQASGFVAGSAQQVLDAIGVFAEAGVTRFMLQHNTLDDLDALDELAAAVLGVW